MHLRVPRTQCTICNVEECISAEFRTLFTCMVGEKYKQQRGKKRQCNEMNGIFITRMCLVLGSCVLLSLPFI